MILCTGYTWRKNHPLLHGLAPWLRCNRDGGYRIERDYRVATEPTFSPGVFLQGFAEETHGASEPVLSLLPVRAGDIVKSLLAPSGTREVVSNYAL
jgi:L-ornithine N5-oxygenase